MPEMGSIHEAASIYKAGIPTEDLLALVAAQLERPELDISGFMVHLGRHDASPETWTGMATALVELIGELLARWPRSRSESSTSAVGSRSHVIRSAAPASRRPPT